MMRIVSRVIKRNGEEVAFDADRIKKAITLAMKNGSGLYDKEVVKNIVEEAVMRYGSSEEPVTINEIELFVYDALIKHDQALTARAYEEYRSIQKYKRETKNATDESVLGIFNCTNKEVGKENSNKNEKAASTQRDLAAGELNKDLFRRKVAPAKIIQAHDNGILHYHDMDYSMQSIFNCCLVNIKDMLDNGTVINGNMVESPKSFQTACTVMTQIMAQVASGQYGGQSIAIKHLGRYLRRTYDKYYKKYLPRELKKANGDMEQAEKWAHERAMERRQEDLESGVQTIQYQINTLQTTNGQAPFVTLFMQIPQGDEYEEEIAAIIEEILNQRLLGIKNKKGVYVTPAFPKLIYVLDENNIHTTSKYKYITNLAVRCSAKRMYPDYISAKKMREIHGDVFSCMGCRSFLSPWRNERGELIWEGRFNQGRRTCPFVPKEILGQRKFLKLLEVPKA